MASCCSDLLHGDGLHDVRSNEQYGCPREPSDRLRGLQEAIAQHILARCHDIELDKSAHRFANYASDEEHRSVHSVAASYQSMYSKTDGQSDTRHAQPVAESASAHKEATVSQNTKYSMSTKNSRREAFRCGASGSLTAARLCDVDSAHSAGSVGHPTLCQRQCRLYWKGLCTDGANCSFCHLPHNRLNPVHLDPTNRRVAHKLNYRSKIEMLTIILEAKIQELNLGRPAAHAFEEWRREMEMTLPQEQDRMSRVDVRSLPRFEKFLCQLNVVELADVLPEREWPKAALNRLAQALQEAARQLKSANPQSA